jgi:hypothetical protein
VDTQSSLALEEFLVIKKNKINDLERKTLLEEVSLRQKSRERWLRVGDKCIKFFHRVASLYRRNNSLEHLVVNSTICSN